MKELEELAFKLIKKFVSPMDEINVSKAVTETPRGRKYAYIMPINRDFNKAGAILVFQWLFDRSPNSITISVKMSSLEKTINVSVPIAEDEYGFSGLNVFSNIEKLIQIFPIGFRNPEYSDKIVEVVDELIKSI